MLNLNPEPLPLRTEFSSVFKFHIFPLLSHREVVALESVCTYFQSMVHCQGVIIWNNLLKQFTLSFDEARRLWIACQNQEKPEKVKIELPQVAFKIPFNIPVLRKRHYRWPFLDFDFEKRYYPKAMQEHSYIFSTMTFSLERNKFLHCCQPSKINHRNISQSKLHEFPKVHDTEVKDQTKRNNVEHNHVYVLPLLSQKKFHIHAVKTKFIICHLYQKGIRCVSHDQLRVWKKFRLWRRQIFILPWLFVWILFTLLLMLDHYTDIPALFGINVSPLRSVWRPFFYAAPYLLFYVMVLYFPLRNIWTWQTYVDCIHYFYWHTLPHVKPFKCTIWLLICVIMILYLFGIFFVLYIQADLYWIVFFIRVPTSIQVTSILLLRLEHFYDNTPTATEYKKNLLIAIGCGWDIWIGTISERFFDVISIWATMTIFLPMCLLPGILPVIFTASCRKYGVSCNASIRELVVIVGYIFIYRTSILLSTIQLPSNVRLVPIYTILILLLYLWPQWSRPGEMDTTVLLASKMRVACSLFNWDSFRKKESKSIKKTNEDGDISPTQNHPPQSTNFDILAPIERYMRTWITHSV